MKTEFSYLLPRGLRPLGFVFALVGIVLAYFRFHYGYKPEFLAGKIFAFYSYYLDSKFFQPIKNQLLEEIAGVFLLVGLFLIAFTKEKVEGPELDALRFKAFFFTAYLNMVFLLMMLLFTFGLGFVYMLVINMGLGLFIYAITCRVLFIINNYKRRYCK